MRSLSLVGFGVSGFLGFVLILVFSFVCLSVILVGFELGRVVPCLLFGFPVAVVACWLVPDGFCGFVWLRRDLVFLL